jgi:hypothetical protein
MEPLLRQYWLLKVDRGGLTSQTQGNLGYAIFATSHDAQVVPEEAVSAALDSFLLGSDSPNLLTFNYAPVRIIGLDPQRLPESPSWSMEGCEVWVAKLQTLYRLYDDGHRITGWLNIGRPTSEPKVGDLIPIPIHIEKLHELDAHFEPSAKVTRTEISHEFLVVDLETVLLPGADRSKIQVSAKARDAASRKRDPALFDLVSSIKII